MGREAAGHTHPPDLLIPLTACLGQADLESPSRYYYSHVSQTPREEPNRTYLPGTAGQGALQGKQGMSP